MCEIFVFIETSIAPPNDVYVAKYCNHISVSFNLKISAKCFFLFLIINYYYFRYRIHLILHSVHKREVQESKLLE